eukprot:CAMPEP_0206218378 /NCGR_PEP_ID=MMETSP0047_2-20121206/3768_1 /ASSEMBLY_ACC=CAM_ASM_000192 /TAXON_ID=195065 /ORGANISM="Chroomonas mesostigmatica_cf, Strain CCMP1168" /LENGTH=92 /DNA_ID=CAMNT_0053640879 /DNA_START=24 /DNA_END=302 /DNA_ORIENTATION=+
MIRLSNKTKAYQEINVEMMASDAFLCAGYRQAAVPVLPMKEIRVFYVLVPVLVGHLDLPGIKLKWKADGKEVTCQAPPTKIFVAPALHEGDA